MLLFVDLVRGCVFGGGETRGSVRVGVALCDLLVTLLGSSRHGTLDRLGGLVDSVLDCVHCECLVVADRCD